MRAMLDELMGKERDVPLPQRSQKKISWDDSAVCKYQLCGLCPSMLFRNTKSALGGCCWGQASVAAWADIVHASLHCLATIQGFRGLRSGTRGRAHAISHVAQAPGDGSTLLTPSTRLWHTPLQGRASMSTTMTIWSGRTSWRTSRRQTPRTSSGGWQMN